MAASPWRLRGRVGVGGMSLIDPSSEFAPANRISPEELAGYKIAGYGYLIEALAFLQPQTVPCDLRTVDTLSEAHREENPSATPEEIEAAVDAQLTDADCDDRLPAMELVVFRGKWPNVEDNLGMFYLYNVRLVSEDENLVAVTCNVAPGIEGILQSENQYLNRVASVVERLMDTRDVRLDDDRLFRVERIDFPFDDPAQQWTGHRMHEQFKSKLDLFGVTEREEVDGVLRRIRRAV